MAKYFNMFKSNVYDRKKQKLNFEIRGLTQWVFDLQDDIKFEKKEKQKGIRAVNSSTRELKKLTKLYNNGVKKISELELNNSLIQPDIILKNIHEVWGDMLK